MDFVRQSRKSIWIFSDAGGAKQALAAYKLIVPQSKYLHHTLLTDRWHSFYNMFQLPVHAIHYSDIDIGDVLDLVNPDLVVTATSYSSNIELEFIKESCKRNIHVISIIDHNNYPELRFSRTNLEAYPDHIVVFNEDNQAAIRALPLPSHTNTEVLPNLYFDYLVKSFKPALSKEDFWSLHKLNEYQPLVLYAPEPITLIKDKFNYAVDERDGLEMVLQALDKCDIKFNLIYQCHPNQDRKILKPFENNHWTYGKADVTDAIWYADAIISFSSNSIFEARALGKKTTISLMSHLIPEHFKHVRKENLGYTIENTEELTQLLNQILI